VTPSVSRPGSGRPATRPGTGTGPEHDVSEDSGSEADLSEPLALVPEADA